MDLILLAAADTDKGQVNEHNEDTVYAQLRAQNLGISGGLFIVADGVGGHKAGEVASRIVVDTITTEFGPFLEPNNVASNKEVDYGIDILESKLVQAIHDANIAVYQYAQGHQSEAGNLGSTVTCAVVINDQAVIANVGDSRTYHYHDGSLKQITVDHSLVGEMVRKGIVAPEEMYTHPHRSVITRALGNDLNIQVDVFRVSLVSGDMLFLCSDGLWEMIRSPVEIADTLSSDDDPGKIVKNFVEKANQYGGKDNIGVVVAILIKA